MSLFASCADLLDTPSPVCPGCREHAPRWAWVRIDGLRVLTHDGDLICPRDRSFGYAPLVVPVSAPVPVVLGVAA
jgi:hypothetical protein